MKSLEYFSIKNFNIDINITDLENINIISYDCTENIDNWKITDKNVELDISLCFKILYTTPESQSLKILRHSSYSYDIISLPDRIDGFNLHKLHNRKMLQPKCTISSLSLLCCDSSSLCFSLLIINEVKILRSLSVLYKVDESIGGSYLYSSDIFFKNFSQLNFLPKYYNHICFSPYDDNIFYYNDNNVYSYSLQNNNDICLFTDNFLQWFCNIEPNKFLIYRNCDDYCKILIKDVKSNNEVLVYKCKNTKLLHCFCFNSNILGFTLCDDINKSLIILDIYGAILFNINCECEKITINSQNTFIIGSNNSTLILIDLIKGSFQNIPIPVNNFIIDELVFFSDNTAIISGTSNLCSYILSFDIKKLLFNNLIEGNFTISSIAVDNMGNIIFASNELGFFNVYSLTTGYTPKLSLKLFANNLSLLVRK